MKIQSPSRRIVEIDITKGTAGFLMIMAHIAGKGMLPFGTFGAVLFFFCSGMNTVLFMGKFKGLKGANFYHIFFVLLLFFGGYTQIKIAHPSKTAFIPEFLQFSALAVLLVFLLAKLFKNPLHIGYLFPLPFLFHTCFQAGLFPFLHTNAAWRYFLLGPGGFSLFPWAGYFLYGILLLHIKDKKNSPLVVILSTGSLAAVFIFLLKMPIEKFSMSLSYIFLSLFTVSCLFFFFKFTWSRVRGKTGFLQAIQSYTAVVGRNSLMFVYLHYFASHYLRINTVSIPLPPTAELLLHTFVYFAITLFFLVVYEKIKGHHDLVIPTVTAGVSIALLRYSGSFGPKMDLRLVDILIGVIFAFIYVQLRELFRNLLRKKSVNN